MEWGVRIDPEVSRHFWQGGFLPPALAVVAGDEKGGLPLLFCRGLERMRVCGIDRDRSEPAERIGLGQDLYAG